METYSFIVLSLCNNDMSAHLKAALEQFAPLCVKQGWGEADLKGVVLLHVVGSEMQSMAMRRQTLETDGVKSADWEGLKKVERYLWDALEVRFCRHAPDVDHDNGSAYYNVHSQQVYLY